ncbi:MAG: YaiI/YqxD family protein [Clostridia bacterium]|nr:YaiI/YqxD family protein [Clostridia bacterium]
MIIYVDADACPVKDIIISEAKKRSIEVVMVCDTAHELNDGYSTVITVDKSSDSADLKIANLVTKGDIVVTQDFGVATLVLGKGAKAINQNGMIYTNDNIDRLMFERFLGKKIRRAGGRTANPSKRTKEDDENFLTNFIKLIVAEH